MLATGPPFSEHHLRETPRDDILWRPRSCGGLGASKHVAAAWQARVGHMPSPDCLAAVDCGEAGRGRGSCVAGIANNSTEKLDPWWPRRTSGLCPCLRDAVLGQAAGVRSTKRTGPDVNTPHMQSLLALGLRCRVSGCLGRAACRAARAGNPPLQGGCH